MIARNIKSSLQTNKGYYTAVLSYYNENGKRIQRTKSTGLKAEKKNRKKAESIVKEVEMEFRIKVKESVSNKSDITIETLQNLAELNTTNFNTNKETKADWDFYTYMEYWLTKIIKNSVETDTYNGYKRNVCGWMKKYFTMTKHKKTVKEITAEDLDDFYNYLREQNLKNSTIDHYNDNISSAFRFLLKKKLVRYNPTEQINPIVVEVLEVATYNKTEISKLFDVIKGDIIELPTIFASMYGLRRSEIIGLRKSVFDFENNTFTINHVAIQNDGKDNEEKVYFKDRTKSKKGYRTFPLFPEVKTAVIQKLEQIQQNQDFFGNTYNHKYDEYLFVQPNGDIMQPNFFTRRFHKLIRRNNLKEITPHGLRHSIATLLHIQGIDIRDLQDWLGHESISSTNRYARGDYKKQVSTGNAVLQIFGNNSTTKNSKKRYTIKKKNIPINILQ